MLLADFDYLIVHERDDAVMGQGKVRVYRLPNGYGLNGINSPRAYRFSYRWEFAVLEPDPEVPGLFGDVVFDTPLTSTVAVCRTEEETVAFLCRALEWAQSSPLPATSLSQGERAGIPAR